MEKSRILGVILAGGGSSRFGSDKALAPLGGKSLLSRVIARAKPQVGQLVLSGFARPGMDLPLVRDAEPEQGPLAGILSALRWAKYSSLDVVATFACDTPFFPDDTVDRLVRHLTPDAGVAVARSGGAAHHAFAVWRTASLALLETSYALDMRSLRQAQIAVRSVDVEFSPTGPEGRAFFNINTPADLAAAENWLAKTPIDNATRKP